MRTISSLSYSLPSILLLSSSLFLPISAAVAPPTSSSTSSTSSPAIDKNLEASAAAAQSWIELIDKNDYDKSWDAASLLTQSTANKQEWNRILEKTRKPLGQVKSRSMIDQRTAKDPNGLPQGDYMVIVYKTSFDAKPSAYELLTLFLQNGQWRVLTYQVD